MTCLTISLLGSLDIRLDDQPMASSITGKACALLAYLAVEAARPHRRETLAGLLWPDYEQRSARANLRNTLSNLRHAIGDRARSGDRDTEQPHLLVTRETIQFNRASDCRVDVAAFSEWVKASTSTERHLEKAITLYRGPFLDGFVGGDSSAFDNWTFGIRERLAHQLSAALQTLAQAYEQRGKLGHACELARQRVEQAPWQEQAHGDLMRLLARSGQRGAALAQYEACRRALRQELDVEPGEETRRLYARIRDGTLAPPEPQEDTDAVSTSRKTQTHPILSSGQPGFPQSSPPGEKRRPQGERRIVTALIAGVKGTTDLAEQIDDEDWLEIIDHVLHILSAEIGRYGGEIDQFRGNGLVAFFGRTAAHEDDPERAVLAALALQDAVKQYAAELRAHQGADTKHPIDLSLRVGVNTGEVIAATVGDRHWHSEDTAMGRAIDLASRIESACEPGTVLVTGDTYRLVSAIFEWQALGEIAVQGISQPIAVYRPLAPRTIPGKGRGIEGLESPLVGRDEELMALRKTLDNLQRGIGGIVTLVGEAGIGKSRLIAELCKPPLALPVPPLTFQWIEGRCLSYGGSTAYLPWLDMLHGLARVAPDAPLAVVDEALRARVQALCPDCFDTVYPYLCRLMSLPLGDDYETVRNMQGESLRAEIFRAVQTLIESAAAQRPLVMVCEDLHWADAASLALLDQVLALTDRAALLLICVFRPEVEHACWQLKETAARTYRHRHTDLWLDALSADESRTLVSYLLRVDALPAALRAKILDHAEGNPFYVEEIVRTLIDNGTIVCDDATEHWKATPEFERQITDIPIPDTLHGVLMARIDRLEAETQRVLRLASVIGRIFTYPLLSAIATDSLFPLTRSQNIPMEKGGDKGEGKSSLDTHLITLQRAQLIRERARVPELEYIFKHELTREAAYSGLLRRERRIYHRRVAEELERLFPEQMDEQVELLAHHWEQAGEADKAIHYLHQAGDKAIQLSAYREARAHLTRALSLLMTRPDSPERAERELALQLLLALAWMFGESLVAKGAQAYARARVLCQQLGKTSELPSIVGMLANCYYVGGEYQQALELAKEAMHLGQQAGDPVLVAVGHWRLGFILFALGEYAAARVHLEHIIAFYKPRYHRAFLLQCWTDPGASALAYNACCLWCLGYPEQALKQSQEALALARELGHPASLVEILHFAGGMFDKMRRDAQALKRNAEEMMQLTDEKGMLGFLALATCDRGAALIMLGQVEQGMAQLRDGLAYYRSIGVEVLLSEHLCPLAEGQAKAGHPEQGLATLDEALALVEKTDDHHWEAELHRVRGELLLMQGDHAGAEISLVKAIEVARRQQARSWELRATTSLARLWQDQGKIDEARQVLAKIYGWFTEGFDTADLREAKALLEELSS